MSSPPPDFAALVSSVQNYFNNFTSNVSRSFSNLTLRDYIRLVWIIGGYLFLRPYIDMGFRKLWEWTQGKEEKTQAVSQAQGVTANALREGRIGEELADEDVGESNDVPQWGKAARRRQKQAAEYLQKSQSDNFDEVEDADIADLLEDD